MSIAYADEWKLFALDEFEENLATLLRAQIPMPVTIHTRFTSDTKSTPRVELELNVGKPQGHQYIRNPGNANGWAQPFDAWLYDLTATIVTERTQNGEYHIPTIGRVRYNLQYFRLLQTLTLAVSPYHTLTTIAESAPQTDSIDDAGNLQTTMLTFSGIMNIRESVWPNA